MDKITQNTVTWQLCSFEANVYKGKISCVKDIALKIKAAFDRHEVGSMPLKNETFAFNEYSVISRTAHCRMSS